MPSNACWKYPLRNEGLRSRFLGRLSSPRRTVHHRRKSPGASIHQTSPRVRKTRSEHPDRRIHKLVPSTNKMAGAQATAEVDEEQNSGLSLLVAGRETVLPWPRELGSEAEGPTVLPWMVNSREIPPKLALSQYWHQMIKQVGATQPTMAEDRIPVAIKCHQWDILVLEVVAFNRMWIL